MDLLNETLSNKASTMRFCLLFVVIMITLTWSGISIYNGAVLNLPANVIGLVGIMVTGKVAQRFKEGGKV